MKSLYQQLNLIVRISSEINGHATQLRKGKKLIRYQEIRHRPEHFRKNFPFKTYSDHYA